MYTTTVTSCLAIAALVTSTLAQSYPPPNPPKGKAIQWMGHSFHFFLPEPVAQLAKEANIQGHVNLGVDRIGASTPCQHWNKGGDNGTNPVKDMLKSGKANVLTASTQASPSEECIPKFAKLAHQYNKAIRVMVHETWLPASSSQAENCQGMKGCANRDAATPEILAATKNMLEKPYQSMLRNSLKRVNQGIGANTTSLVPVWEAVISLRELAVKGQLPGVAKQSALFRDSLGHPDKPLRDMASYMWFGALYGINPKGSKVLAAGNAQQAAILQKLAWETLSKEPLNGLGWK